MSEKKIPLIRVPNKPDLTAVTYGDTGHFNADTLHYLRMRDDKMGFIIDVMTDDALRNGAVYATPEDEERGKPFEPILREAWKQVREFGWTTLMHFDGTEADIMKNIYDQSVKVFAIHPFVTGVGGIRDYKTNKTTGFPTEWIVKFTPYALEDTTVSASRTDIWTGPRAGNWWQGYPAGINAYDDIVALRMWRATSMRRLRDYATIRYIIKLLNMTPGTPVPTAIRDEIKESMSDAAGVVIPHAVVPGDVGIEQIGGPVQPEELGISTDKADKGAAVGAGISVADMTGAEAGQKLSVDANQATYAYALKDIQRDAYPFFKKTYERLGVEITGFKSPSEIPPSEKYELLAKLDQLYNSAAPSLKEVYGELISDFMMAEFNIEVEVDAAGDQEYNDQQMEMLMSNDKNESGNSGGASPPQGKNAGDRKGGKGRGSKEKGGRG